MEYFEGEEIGKKEKAINSMLVQDCSIISCLATITKKDTTPKEVDLILNR